jgi:GNAT superfamily N-acetyltransferase
VNKKVIHQPEKNNPFWQQLPKKLIGFYEGKLELVFPKELNKHYFSWFHKIEERGFRQELQYSLEQLEESLKKPELILWFLTVNDEPKIILFGYPIQQENKKIFYLDTFAVNPRGKGIGNIIIEFIIRWAQTKKYTAIILDTELKDEKGFPLKEFYEKHGFEIVSSSKKGDLIMKRNI